MKVYNVYSQCKIPIVVAFAVAGSQAYASGLSFRTQSIRSSSMAMAGDGLTMGDASSQFTNPANVVALDAQSVTLNMQFINSTQKWDGTWGSQGNAKSSQSAEDISSVVPSIFGAHPIGNNMAVGWYYSPSAGGKLDYKDDFHGRYSSLDVVATAVDLGLTFGYKLNDQLSFGAGLFHQSGHLEIETAADLGTVGAAQQTPGATPYGADSIQKYEGDSTGIGYQFGVTYKPMPALNIGFSFRSEVEQKTEGSVTWTDANALATGIRTSAAASIPALSPSDDASAVLYVPQIMMLAGSYTVMPALDIYLNITHTKWSPNEILKIKFNNTSSDEPLNYIDTVSYSLGASYKLDPSIVLRGGLGIDPKTVENKNVGFRGGVGDEVIVGLGGTWMNGPIEVDAGINYHSISSVNASSPGTTTGIPKPGYDVDSESTLTNFMLAGSYKF